MDMLSTMPQDVKAEVLSYLPIKEAVRTSILSNEWRYSWTSIPGLVICDSQVIFKEDATKVGYYRLIVFDDTLFVTKIEGKLEDAQVCKMQGWMVNGKYLFEESPAPLSFNRIRSIELKMNFEDENEAAFVLALLKRASHLQSLVIHVDLPGERQTEPTAKFWYTIVDERKSFCEHLVTAHMIDMKAADSINAFVRFILRSPELEKLVIENLPTWPWASMIFVMNNLGGRASKKAKILFEGSRW